MKIPENVSLIIDRLEQNGFLAYVVGGCVRDTLMDRIPDDWDITTNALPGEILDVFKGFKTIKTGIKHGTVTVIIDHIPYEITTFRIDGEYQDLRHPQSVNFVSSLYEDLKRRDFTVNALAYNEKTGICDYFGGIDDIKNKVIKCVGNPEKRFLEDALRIMRAIRFSSQLNFDIEPSTNDAILKCSHLLKNISIERIQIEFLKTLMSDNPKAIYDYRTVFKQFFDGFECRENIVPLLQNTPKILHIRLTLMIYNLYQNQENDIETFGKVLLKNLRFDNLTIKKCYDLLSCINTELKPQKTDLRHHIKNHGYDTIYDLILFKKSLFYDDENNFKNINKIHSIFEEIKSQKLCSTLKELAVDGNDLILCGFKKGKDIGKILDFLLTLVIEEKTANTHELLLNEAKKLKLKMEE